MFVFVASLLLAVNSWSQDKNVNRMPMLGSQAPSFTAESTTGKISFPGDFGNSWKILFSHPKDFTPVCSSELLELAYYQEEFEQLGTKLAVLSTDVLSQHLIWKTALEEIDYKDRGKVVINFPLISDDGYRASNLYGMIHPDVSIGQNIRGVFIINPDNRVMAINYYPNEVGRNIDEIKRTLIALQATYNNRNIATPANWQPGDDFMVPVLSDTERTQLNSPGSFFYQLSWFMTFKRNQD